MKNVLKNLSKVVFYFLVIVGVIFVSETALNLMNQSSTLFFLGGLLILLLVAFFVVGMSMDSYTKIISLIQKQKNKKNQNDKL